MSGGADGITDMDADYGNMDDEQPDSADGAQTALQIQIWKKVPNDDSSEDMIDPNEELVPIDEAPGMSAGEGNVEGSNDTGIKGIYKKYQQGKMKVPVLKNVEFLHGRRRICRNHGTIRFGKNYSDEHYRMSGQADRGDFFSGWSGY